MDETKCLLSATMPVIKVKCDETFLNKRIDISLQDSKHNGLACVELVRKFVNAYPPLRPMTLVLK